MQERSFIFSFKLILKGILLCAIVVVGLKYTGEKYAQAAKENTINAFTQQRFKEFYETEKNTLDMVFIGSSHSYCTFDPSIIDEGLNTNSWQMGTPNQLPSTTYYVLKEIYNYQTPKTVVMELYWDVMDTEFELKQADNVFEVLENEELKAEYVKKVFPMGDKVKYNIPAIRFQQDYFAYESKKIQKTTEEKYGVHGKAVAQANGVEYYKGKGYVFCDIILPEDEYDRSNQFKKFDGKDWDFNKTQKQYIEKIIKLCEEKGSKLIFVTAPVANVSMDFIKNY
ncbi:MAG: hypothetical protein ACRCW1_05135, partial [Anaerotignaceae bacterium]